MIRRDFLRRLGLTAAGLLVADDALELLAEPRRFWPGADFPGLTPEPWAGAWLPTQTNLNAIWSKVQASLIEGFRYEGFQSTPFDVGPFVKASSGVRSLREITIPL